MKRIVHRYREAPASMVPRTLFIPSWASLITICTTPRSLYTKPLKTCIQNSPVATTNAMLIARPSPFDFTYVASTHTYGQGPSGLRVRNRFTTSSRSEQSLDTAPVRAVRTHRPDQFIILLGSTRFGKKAPCLCLGILSVISPTLVVHGLALEPFLYVTLDEVRS